MPYSFTGDIVLRFTVSVNKYFPRESFRGIMPEDSIGMNAGCFVRIFGHSVFVLGRRSCRRAFRHVCVEFRFSPLREPCPPAHSIRVVAQPNIHRGFSVARFRNDLPARRLREPRARFDGVLSSPSHDWFTQGQSLLLRATKPLQICHVACLAAEVVFLTLFVNAAFRNPLADASLSLLMEPEMLAIAGVGVIGMGIALPITLETYSITRKECRAIPVSDFICLLGGLCLRYCLITCGVH